MVRLLKADKAAVTQITTGYNRVMQTSIPECTTRETLKQMGPHQVPFVSAKNTFRIWRIMDVQLTNLQ